MARAGSTRRPDVKPLWRLHGGRRRAAPLSIPVSGGHCFGDSSLHVLRIFTGIRKLVLELSSSHELEVIRAIEKRRADYTFIPAAWHFLRKDHHIANSTSGRDSWQATTKFLYTPDVGGDQHRSGALIHRVPLR